MRQIKLFLCVMQELLKKRYCMEKCGNYYKLFKGKVTNNAGSHMGVVFCNEVTFIAAIH